jgi:hypothetical protein
MTKGKASQVFLTNVDILALAVQLFKLYPATVRDSQIYRDQPERWYGARRGFRSQISSLLKTIRNIELSILNTPY